MPSAYRFNFASGEIRHSRTRVGSVRRDGDAGLYTATIYERGQRHEFVARDATTAFREAAARAMGHSSAAALRAANAAVRARNRVRRSQSDIGGWDYARTQFATRSQVDVDQLIAQIQADAAAVGETPPSAELIRATWVPGGVR